MFRPLTPAARFVATFGAALSLASAAACHRAAAPAGPAPEPGPGQLRGQPPLSSLGVHHVIPVPASVEPGSGAPFTLTPEAVVVVPTSRGAADSAATAAAARVGDMLARRLRPATGLRIPVTAADDAAPRGAIVLRLDGAATLGAEGYELAITADSVRLTAAAPAGLFHAMQTLRQLFPAGVEADQFLVRPPIPWTVPPGRIVDRPRFAYRGAMLDVARHFFTVHEVEQVIDLLALYKLNALHLHLSDDQGWRIQIDGWPKLTAIGGLTEVGGGRGGYYTKADYAEIVRYAQERFVTIVPEIDMPAHTHAATVAYPELGCGQPIPDTSLNAPLPGLYTGIRVGFSALCYDRDTTYAFVDDVVGQLAAMTPGPWLHLGGDEVAVLTHEQYAQFVERVQDIVARHGKTMIGWDEIGRARLRPGTVAQMWRSDTSMAAVRQGAKLVMSPATNAYLDMKYTPATEIGHRWAAFITLHTAYEWDPVTHFPGVKESDVLGIEGALWTETVKNVTAAEYLLLPRLPALAELGWSPAATHDWESFRTRIAAHAPRWRLLGLNFYPSPEVAWEQ